MTLSVLIPIYNYDAQALVEAMLRKIADEDLDAEIVVGDDGSTLETAWMAAVEHYDGVRVIHSGGNAGRTRICNLMAHQARGEWLLFVDGDAGVPDTFSLKRSIDAGADAPVVCGGFYHPEVNPNPEATLRYKYERAADRHRSAAERSKHPYRKLSTFNLLVRREVFLSIGFDERCTEYGYEDALFGIQLGNKGIAIAHIDNPLIHLGLNDNDKFLNNTETAMRMLRRIQAMMPQDAGLLGAANSLNRYHLTWAMRLFYRLFRGTMLRNLLSRHPSLFVFNLYKLGYFLSE